MFVGVGGITGNQTNTPTPAATAALVSCWSVHTRSDLQLSGPQITAEHEQKLASPCAGTRGSTEEPLSTQKTISMLIIDYLTSDLISHLFREHRLELPPF